MKKLPIVAILLLLNLPCFLHAQTEKSHVINAGAGTIKSENIELTYFIGDYIGLGNTNLTTELVDISVYPNPVKTILYLQTTSTDLEQIQIFNVNGVLLKEEKLLTNEVNFSEYPAGIYFLKVKDKKELEVGSIKVIKQ
jgi:hypothetical protein